ncbi:MAG: hypothetical protein ACK53Y_19205, partial [bacterium]
PTILVPARHPTQRGRTQANIHVTRLARKFPRVQYTQLWKTSHKTINTNTPLTGTKMNRKQREFSPLKRGTTAYDNILSK